MEMFTCEYWSRLWFFQETATPTDVIFYYGDDHKFKIDDVKGIEVWISLFRMIPEWPTQFARFCNSDSFVSKIASLRMHRQAWKA